MFKVILRASSALKGMLPVDYREQELKCPACGSADTKLFVHPELHDVVMVDGLYLATCKACNHEFCLDQQTAELLSAALPLGQTLHIATACSNCKYDLRTLQIGKTCPECGERIPRLVQRFNAEDGNDNWAWNWATILFIGIVAIAVLGTPVQDRRVEIAILLGIVAASYTALAIFKLRAYLAAKKDDSPLSIQRVVFPTSMVLASLASLLGLIWYASVWF